MNLSGKSVKYWMDKEKIPLENIIVIVDDLAIPLGEFRLRKKGSDGGHNGLISIIEHLNNIEFTRLRIGIGNEFAKGYQVNYVLGRWSNEEEKILIPRINLAVDLIKSFVLVGTEKTMSLFNKK